MLDILFKKILIIGILILFIVASVLPATGVITNNNIIIENQKVINEKDKTSNNGYIDWWPTAGHDFTRTHYSSSPGPDTNNILWKTKVGGWIFPSPAIVDDKVYVGSDSDKMYCLNASTGDIIWDYTTGKDVQSSPTIFNGKVYFGSNDNKVYCLNAETGEFIWDYTTGGLVISSPAIYNGKVYFGCYYEDKLYCLDAENGSHIWNFTGDTSIWDPAIIEGLVIIGDHYIRCLDAETGYQIWKFSQLWTRYTYPAIYDNKVYCTAILDGHLYCVDLLTGDFNWRYNNITVSFSGCAINEDRVYAGGDNKREYCVNAQTGEEYWRFQTGDAVKSTPAISVDGKLYFGSYDKKVYCIDAYDGSNIWNYSTGNSIFSSPAIVNNRVYIGSNDGYMYCFGDPSIAPYPPIIDGPANGQVKTKYIFTATADDPDGDNVSYYFDWGDISNSGWTDFVPSGTSVNLSHSWFFSGTYTIKVKAKDDYGMESEWSTFTVKMPRNKIMSNSLLLSFVEQYPLLDFLLQRFTSLKCYRIYYASYLNI